MSCSSKCRPTRIVVNINRPEPGIPIELRRIMVATESGKFRKGTEHPECLDCLKEQVARSVRQMAIEEYRYLVKSGELFKLTDSQLAELQSRLDRGL